ncbi:MAG: hypothetical protein U0992_07955 [Planctomycetaceae bacterium]
MARHEADREDLFAEGTALRQRIELTAPNSTEPVVAGCRAHGGWSIYFGGDPCYHFDPEGRLRRAFADGRLYRTQGDTLARLNRMRSAEVVELRRTDLNAAECAAFLDVMRQRLAGLRQEVASGELACRRRSPAETDVAALLVSALERILASGPQLSPAIPTRRES